jgi:hypothetical protein
MGKRGPQPLPATEHVRRGNWRRDRHQEPDPPRFEADPIPAPPGSRPAHEYVSETDRQAVLSELNGIGWAIANDWLQTHVGWDQLALHLLKHVGLSASRLDALIEDDAVLLIDEVRKEAACYIALIRALRHEEA